MATKKQNHEVEWVEVFYPEVFYPMHHLDSLRSTLDEVASNEFEFVEGIRFARMSGEDARKLEKKLIDSWKELIVSM